MKSIAIVIPFIVISLPLVSGLTMDFFYSSNCGECEKDLQMIEKYFVKNESNKGILKVYLKDIATNKTAFEEWKDEYDFYPYPFVVIKNETKSTPPIGESDITVGNLKKIIGMFLNGTYHEREEEDIIHTPFGEINAKSISLPLLAIILGGADSFNPCAFFILIFLLNMLLHAGSRRKMLLVGGIFVTFSALFYMLFMFFMYETFMRIQTRENVMLISVIAGCIVLPMGIINIKDFFLFRKGVSLSVPESKRVRIFKRVRDLIRKESTITTIAGAIALAGTVNFYELLCTLGLPFTFTKILSQYSIGKNSLVFYTYILLYNIVYVLPLVTIVLIFALTLGRRRFSEWHGRVMKLFSGIMLAVFGFFFLYNYKLLEDPFTPISIVIGSAMGTFLISTVWKRYEQKRS